MSDWNTLHLFDSKKFYKKIVPELRKGGGIIDVHIKSKLFWYITRIDEIDGGVLNNTKLFLKDFDTSFRFHTELFKIENRQKKKEEDYKDFIKKKNVDIEEFNRKYSDEIYWYTTVFPFIVFTECAQFNPHLIIGRRIFTTNISATQGSLAEECFEKITSIETGGFYNDVGYVINWLTYQEVKLLWLDIENTYASVQESEQYYRDFINFLEIAVENELGFISISNINEDVIKLIETPKLNIDINLQEMGFVNVIEYK